MKIDNKISVRIFFDSLVPTQRLAFNNYIFSNSDSTALSFDIVTFSVISGAPFRFRLVETWKTYIHDIDIADYTQRYTQQHCNAIACQQFIVVL